MTMFWLENSTLFNMKTALRIRPLLDSTKGGLSSGMLLYFLVQKKKKEILSRAMSLFLLSTLKLSQS